MKLVSLVLVTLLAASGSARADEVLQPPGGPVYVSDPPMQQQQQRGQRGQRGKQLRRAMLEAFDANGDGRLGPRERTRAIRVLRRIEQRLGTPTQPGQPSARQRGARRFIQRYDMNHDGNVGPGEMPPAAAGKLRRLDQDRDGWVEPNEDQ